MFIATRSNQDLFRSVRSETSTEQNHLPGRRAPTERRVLGAASGYKHVAPSGRSQREAVLHFKVEFTNEK
jgi:hypothetical protein